MVGAEKIGDGDLQMKGGLRFEGEIGEDGGKEDNFSAEVKNAI